MAFQKGSSILWQLCPMCGKKKVHYEYRRGIIPESFFCTSCKKDVTPKFDAIEQAYPGFVRVKYRAVN